jgi:hypothetical protein
MRRLHHITYLPGDYSGCPPGSIVTVVDDPDNRQLDGIDGAFLASRGLRALVMATARERELVDPAQFDTHLVALQTKLAAKGITPWAIALGDEWFDLVNHPRMVGWSCFEGMRQIEGDMRRRKQWLYPRLQELFRRLKAHFPAIPTVQVETKINEDQASGAGLWYPDCGADVLAIDAYLWADGASWLGTSPLTPDSPVEKFGREVAWMLTGTPAGFQPRITGAFAQGKPVILVAQAFHDVAGGWRTLPTVRQLQWYWEYAVNTPQIVGWAVYAWSSVPGLSVGLDQLPAHAAAVAAMYQQMQSWPAVPDPSPGAVAPAPAPDPTTPVPPAPTTPALPSTLCTIAVRSDRTLVITAADGRVQTVAV